MCGFLALWVFFVVVQIVCDVGILFDCFLLFHFVCMLVWCFWFGVFLSDKRSLFQSGGDELPKQSKN